MHEFSDNAYELRASLGGGGAFARPLWPVIGCPSRPLPTHLHARTCNSRGSQKHCKWPTRMALSVLETVNCIYSFTYTTFILSY